MAKKQAQRGRPSLGRTEHLEVMLTPDEKQRFSNAAGRYGLSLSDWVRLNLSAASQPPKAGKPRDLLADLQEG